MNIVKYKNIFLGIFISIIVIGIALLLIYKPVFGIDFTGGGLIEIKLQNQTNISEVREKASGAYSSTQLLIQSSGKDQYIIRAKISENEFENFKSKISGAFPDAQILRHENIGATVGKNLAQKAIYGLIIACVLIILYLAYAFRTVPRSVSSWTFGIISIVALIHDLVITTALYSTIGHFFKFEFEGITVVAILTILGFSVHDTIVIFDRIRENLIKNPQLKLQENINHSINQTLSRSLNTSLTVIIVLVSMYLLGGTTTRPFVLILTMGIAIGTYSSIFVASPLLIKYIEYTKRSRE